MGAALISLEHMGLWMLPVPWQPGAGGLLEPPLAPHLTCSFARWFLARVAVKKPKGFPTAPRRAQRHEGRAAQLPSPMWGTLPG